jgi:hypothetical protein
MFGKTSNRWLIALLTVSVLAFAVPQTAAAAPFKAEPAGASLGLGQQLVQWAAELWSGLGSVFDASTTTTTTGTGGGTPQSGTGTGGEQGGMIDPNGG